MCQYAARDGRAQIHHHVNYGRFAMGGAGLVMVEVTAVMPQGMGTPGDLGLWNDEQQQALAQVALTITELDAVPAIQLGHAGRKGSCQRPWHGGAPLGGQDLVERGEQGWTVVAPSSLPISSVHQNPIMLDFDGIEQIGNAFVEAASRAVEAGFRVIEIHAAHGYLLHQFLSAQTNKRNDLYGGGPTSRRVLLCSIVRRIKTTLPTDCALFVRVSAEDALDPASTIDDTVQLAAALKEAGVDAIDCSSGGLMGRASASQLVHKLGYQVPFAAAIRRGASIPTVAVGLILDGPQAEAILQAGDAELIAIGRAALDDPNWPLRAQSMLGAEEFDHWPSESGWWLARRARLLAEIREGQKQDEQRQ